MSFLQENRLKFLYEAVQHSSVRAAADFLNIAPSAVSRQISQLELELDTVLIERHRRGIIATEAGNKLITYYKQYLIQQEVLLDSLKSLRKLESGTIELAVGEGFINKVTKAMYSFNKEYPNIKIILSAHNSNDIIRKVVDDDVHIGVIFNPPNHPKIRFHYNALSPMVVAVNKNHPINQAPLPIKMSTLREYNIALPEIAHGVRQLIENVEKDTGITLTPNVISNSLTALHYYASNGGVTIIPEFMLKSTPYWSHTLNSLPLKNSNLNSMDTAIFTRLGRQLAPAPTEFLKYLISSFKDEI